MRDLKQSLNEDLQDDHEIISTDKIQDKKSLIMKQSLMQSKQGNNSMAGGGEPLNKLNQSNGTENGKQHQQYSRNGSGSQRYNESHNIQTDNSIILFEKLKSKIASGSNEAINEEDLEKLKQMYEEGEITIQEKKKHGSTVDLGLSQSSQQGFQEYKLYRRRYFVMFFYGCNQLMSSILFSTTLSISQPLQEAYDVGGTYISNISLIFLMMYPFATFPSSWLIQKKGIQIAYYLGTALMMIGAGIRLLINAGNPTQYSIFVLIIGSVLSGSARPIIVNMQSNVVKNWCSVQERSSFISILSFLGTFGLILGTILPGFLFTNVSINDHELIRDKAFLVMAVEGAMTIGVVLPSYFFFKETPPSPPSYAALKNQGDELNLWQSLKLLFKERDYIFIFIVFSILFGVLKAFNVILSDFLKIFGICSSQYISILLLCPIPLGFLGSGIIAILMKKRPLYRIYTLFFLLICIISTILFYLAMLSGDQYLIGGAVGLLGLGIIPIIPVLAEWAQEVAFPIQESYIYGTLMSGGQLSGALVGYIAEYIIELSPAAEEKCHKGVKYSTDDPRNSIIFFISILLFSMIFPFITRENLKRTNQQKQKEKIIEKVQTLIEENTNGNLVIQKSHQSHASSIISLH